MSRTLLKTVSIESNVLQMFSSPTSSNRTITIEYTDAAKMSVSQIVNFKTNRFIDEENYEDVIFDSLLNYFKVTVRPLSHQQHVPFDDDYLTSLFAVLATGELYDINDKTFYYRGPFNYDDFKYDLYRRVFAEVNKGKHIVSVAVDNWEGDLIIQAEPIEQGKGHIKGLFVTLRYTMEIGNIFKAIRRFSRVTATPQSIFKSLTSRLL